MLKQIFKSVILAVFLTATLIAGVHAQGEEVILPATELDNIQEIAANDFDHAMEVYGEFVDVVIAEKASSPADLQRLLTATLAFSEGDGSNDHYFLLLDVWTQFPVELETAIDAMTVDAETKVLIRLILQSVKDAE